MTGAFRPIVNLADLAREVFRRGDVYESVDAPISEYIGLTQIGAVLTEVPPGKSACPFHVHHVEDEMFIVLSGTGEYRFGEDIYPVGAGDVLGAPRGGVSYAHKLTNTGTATLRYLCISSKSDTEVCEYPDSGKLMVRSSEADGQDALRFVARVDDARDYWDGEDGA